MTMVGRRVLVGTMSVLRLSLLASLLVALVAAQEQELLPSTQPAEQLDQGTWTSGNATFTGVPAVSTLLVHTSASSTDHTAVHVC